jgi:hypothetical protein
LPVSLNLQFHRLFFGLKRRKRGPTIEATFLAMEQMALFLFRELFLVEHKSLQVRNLDLIRHTDSILKSDAPCPGMSHAVKAALRQAADPYCASHAQGTPETEDLVVNPNGTLSNVIVYVKSGPEGLTFATPTQPVVIAQRDCKYHPHVFTIMVHQPLLIKNSDATLHNIHMWSMTNMPFNVGQSVRNMETTTTFGKPEMPVPIRCDVHKWMNALAGVFTHPFHTVIHEEGTFELKVPPGK